MLAVLLAAAAPAAAREPGTPIVPLAKVTTVRDHAGWLVFSRWTGGAYVLSTWHAGVVRDLPVAPQAEPFDVDAGPDSDGRPSAIVSLCHGSCDLYVIGFDPGDRLRPVRNANTTGHDETDPSVFDGRLVFVRDDGGESVVPYAKHILWPRSRPSERLAGLPARRCGASVGPRCRPIERRDVKQMELWGRWVGQSWTYEAAGFGGFRQNEIRLTNLDRSDTRQVAFMTTGLGGQRYLGPSFGRGRLAFFRACGGDPAGCLTTRTASGAIRYRISNGAYDIARANRDWWGWAYDGDAYHVPADVTCAEEPGFGPTPACAIYRERSPAFTPVAAERIR